MYNIIIATESGRVYRYVDGCLNIVFEDPKAESLMGMDFYGGFLYVAGKSRIFKINLATGKVVKVFSGRRIDYHQLVIIEGVLYAMCTALNEVWLFDLDLNFISKHVVSPPNINKPIRYKFNYNHVNNIFLYNNWFYVCLNWFENKRHSVSGVSVLDLNMNEVDRFRYGWESHGFCIVNNDRYVLCGSSGVIRKIHHPHRAGLMVNSNFVFEHDADKFFCKDFSIDADYIYIVGGSVNKKDYRNRSKGVIFVLDKKYTLLDTILFKNSGGICGCLVNNDFTKCGGLYE